MILAWIRETLSEQSTPRYGFLTGTRAGWLLLLLILGTHGGGMQAPHCSCGGMERYGRIETSDGDRHVQPTARKIQWKPEVFRGARWRGCEMRVQSCPNWASRSRAPRPASYTHCRPIQGAGTPNLAQAQAQPHHRRVSTARSSQLLGPIYGHHLHLQVSCAWPPRLCFFPPQDDRTDMELPDRAHACLGATSMPGQNGVFLDSPSDADHLEFHLYPPLWSLFTKGQARRPYQRLN